jgi:bifunctional NMN adenylyltransferase/nudix hydrolase
MKQFEYCILIARCQPFHHGHYELFKNALAQAETVVFVLGSYKQASNPENPWSAEEREQIIRLALSEEELKQVKFVYARDNWYANNLWLADVQNLVYQVTDGCSDDKICNIGAVNDFPQWKFIYQPNIEHMPHATKIRELYFTHDVAYKQHTHAKVAEWLESFKKTDKFRYLKAGFDYLVDYHIKQIGAPWPYTFVTVDAVVVKSGHVLVVRRKGALGKGLIAMPGGFLNPDESIENAMLRELREETDIQLNKEFLRTHIKEQRVFDYPKRSLRGRVITHAFMIDLDRGPLPQVKGSDDADKAWWMSLKEAASREEEFFEDHFHIISYFAGSPMMRTT